MKLLGIDYGGERTGIAIGNLEEGIAVDYSTLATHPLDKLFDDIHDIIANEFIDQIVVGLPLGNSNKDTVQTRSVRTFAEKLAYGIHIPVVFEDERMSTSVFHQLPRHEREAKGIDALAAMHILQTYIDRVNSEREK